VAKAAVLFVYNSQKVCSEKVILALKKVRCLPVNFRGHLVKNVEFIKIHTIPCYWTRSYS